MSPNYAAILKEHGPQLAKEHINRYTRMIEAHEQGQNHIRPDECKLLRRIWRSIEAKNFEWDILSDIEKSEIYDVVDSGEVQNPHSKGG